MSDPFLAEIRLMAFSFAPKGWAQCNGQFLPINQNQALFSLMGTNYGGDGQTVFQLPDLRGRVPIHMQNLNFTLGQRAGEEAHTVSIQEMPAHTHQLNAASADGDVTLPTGAMLGAFNNGYRAATNLVAIHPSAVTNVGGGQAHENRQPFLVMNYCVALQGIFPAQN